MTGSRKAPARHKRPAPGTRCRCGELIEKSTVAKFPVWVHVADSNIYCQTNLPGFTANFAEPG